MNVFLGFPDSVTSTLGFPDDSVVKNLPANSADEGDVVQSLGQEDPSPGEGNGNPLQCSCLENPMDRGA